MEQSPSREATSHSDSLEIPHLLWNPKVPYRLHNSLLLTTILSQMNPVHTFQPCFSKIHFNIILPSREATCYSTNLEIPYPLWNLKVHYCVHKSPPPVTVLRQMNPIHIITLYYLHIVLFLCLPSGRIILGRILGNWVGRCGQDLSGPE
jgi:hypothetical protein